MQVNNHMYDIFTTYTLKLIHVHPLTQPHMDTTTHAHTQFNRMLLIKEVFNLLLKMATDVACLTVSGKVFHFCGAYRPTLKAASPSLDLVRGMSKLPLPVDQSILAGV